MQIITERRVSTNAITLKISAGSACYSAAEGSKGSPRAALSTIGWQQRQTSWNLDTLHTGE